LGRAFAIRFSPLSTLNHVTAWPNFNSPHHNFQELFLVRGRAHGRVEEEEAAATADDFMLNQSFPSMAVISCARNPRLRASS
jgi:hypothetical protein